ncbi:MAG TPA: SURF1 family protein [Coxiellaceae bacterium]|nr:SURF1 family protein [Coxiellaceae bacterium]
MNRLWEKPLFSIQGFGFVFTCHFITSLIFLLLLALLLHLGFWQIARGEYKKELLRNYQSQQLLPAQNFAPNKSFPPYTKLKLQGTYDNAHSFLLDNSISQHQVGFQVLTPFHIVGYDKAILINRGWIAGNPNRDVLPKIPLVQGKQLISGIYNSFPTKSFVLAKSKASTQWPQIIERLKQSEIENLLGQNIDSHLILLDPGLKGGFRREWAPVQTMPPERHFGYAIQWFALALTLVIIYFFLNIHRDKHGTTR